MKIEMGESLFYSWLRHVKECQVVQTNWKVSPQWTLQHEEELQKIMQVTDKFFSEKYGYHIYKKNASLSQLLRQGECDAVGVSIDNDDMHVYGIDVAFHESGLNYRTREETVTKIITKSIRTAMCLYGFLNCDKAEIVFGSPKINPSILNDVSPCITDLNSIFVELGLACRVRIIANEEFNDLILKPILLVSGGVSDTSELFLRSYQLFSMFNEKEPISKEKKIVTREPSGSIDELKIGQLAKMIFAAMLEEGKATDEEIELMQTSEYSKKTFDLQYPVLAKEGTNFDGYRYYKRPRIIKGERYYLCSQWFETKGNNDRPLLEHWIDTHSDWHKLEPNYKRRNQNG